MRLDDLHHFADGGTGGDHVIDDHHATRQRRAHEGAAFAVVLGFLAVEAPRGVDLMMLGQCHGGGGGQRDTLVGRAEQHIERNAALDHCGRIESA
ncbi:hypothetical protein D9M68_970160 [compost metagenome]